MGGSEEVEGVEGGDGRARGRWGEREQEEGAMM